MGYLLHKAALAHNWGLPYDLALMASATESINREWMNAEHGTDHPIVMVSYGMMNGSVTWTFVVDGSKEGWATSDLADVLRDRFIEACESCQYTDVVLLTMGGDDKRFDATFITTPTREETT